MPLSEGKGGQDRTVRSLMTRRRHGANPLLNHLVSALLYVNVRPPSLGTGRAFSLQTRLHPWNARLTGNGDIHSELAHSSTHLASRRTNFVL
jgi:hypothetical protein